ncbi:MAG: VWA domain-containing protein [Kofleriaceae bacterium]
MISWRHPELVHLIWIAIAFVALLAYLELQSRAALGGFLSPVMQRRLSAQSSGTRTIVRLSLLLACFVFSILALMRPTLPGETETVPVGSTTADVMFVLDVSRSMLAEDAAPNRLARAKAEISQLVGKLEGQRVGLIAFAGRAAPVCPLTPDHSFFNTVLNTVDTRSAGRGGSKVGEAIKTALRAFPTGQGARLIVLITDGDDQDPYTEDAAKLARDQGVKIVAVGFGSEAGSQITLTDPQTGAKTTLMHDGKPVISKLDSAMLGKIALVTEGAYIPAGTSAIDLDAILEQHVKPIVRAAADSATREVPREAYPAMVLLAMIALLASLWVGAGAGDRRSSV